MYEKVMNRKGYFESLRLWLGTAVQIASMLIKIVQPFASA
jgi:hypothetical protein